MRREPTALGERMAGAFRSPLFPSIGLAAALAFAVAYPASLPCEIGEDPSIGETGFATSSRTEIAGSFDASPESWSTDPVDALEYFTEEELTSWRAFRNRARGLSLIRLFLSLLLYAAFSFTFLGRNTYSLAVSIAGFISGLPPFRANSSKRLGSILGRLFGPDWDAAVLFTWLFLLSVALVLLPFQLISEHDARAAGLSVYSTPAWLWDLSKGLLLHAASLTFVVFGLFGLIRRIPRFWWLALGGPAALAMVAWGVLSPYQSRVFYEFTSLDDENLRSRFESIAEKKGIELTDVKVIDASRHTRAINAYVTGLGPSRELVFFDTTLDLLDDNELVAVLAHELGHMDRDRPLLRYSLSAGMMMLILWMLSLVLRSVPPKIGLDGPGDPRALPLLLLVVSLVFLSVRPLERAWSRHEERLADRSGLILTQDPDGFVRLKVKLARHNRADVDPPAWVNIWFATHPSILERIGTARWYESWLAERRASIRHPASSEASPP